MTAIRYQFNKRQNNHEAIKQKSSKDFNAVISEKTFFSPLRLIRVAVLQ
jgi:hypothetical protein